MKQAPAPRLATWLLSLLLSQRDQEMLIGDLVEEHALLAASQRPRDACQWYWNQVLRSLAPLLWANIRRGLWLKTLGAVLIGYLAVAVLVMAGDVVMSKLLSAGQLVYSLVSLAVGFPAMMLGGYLAAWMRTRAALALAVFSAAMAVVSLAVTGDRAPLWYQIALIVIAPVGAIVGGRIRVRVKNGARL